MLPDGRFVTAEKGIPRIKVYSPRGEFECVVAGPKQMKAVAADLAADRRGRILALDPSNGQRAHLRAKPASAGGQAVTNSSQSSETVREPANTCPLSLRERVRVRGSAEQCQFQGLHSFPGAPHPNPLPEGEGDSPGSLSLNRREMCRTALRWTALGGIAMLSAGLIGKRAGGGAGCRRADACRQCGLLAECRLPQAQEARKEPARQ